MTTYLTRQFVQDAQRNSYSLTFDGREITLAATEERTFGSFPFVAELQVEEGGAVLGYITPYGDNEHGAVRERLFGQIAPALFRTLDEALLEILS